MKTQFNNQIRNAYHILIGFTVMYALGIWTDFSDYTLWSKIIGVSSISAFIGVAVGGFWEWLQGKLTESSVDYKDVARTAVGSLIGGITSLFYVSHTIMWVLIALSIIIVLNDFITKWKLKKK